MVEEINWTVELEVSLFHAMRKHKPVGIPKHFQMTCIHDKLNNSVSQNITAGQIWRHLSTMFDSQALDNSEKVPFPNKFTEFTLPKDEYNEIISENFPRASEGSMSGTPSNEGSTKDTKERDRHGSGSSTRGGSKAQASEKSTPKVSVHEDKMEETPKRDARKRTRHSLQSPATDGTPSGSHKRQRRI